MLRMYKDLSFGTSPDNEFGLKLNLKFDEDTKTAYSSEISIASHYQGHNTDHVHPGILAAMLDEIMMYISNSLDMQVETGELTIRYLQPARTESDLHLRGYFVKKNKKVVENRAEIEDDIGKIVARAKGKYVEVGFFRVIKIKKSHKTKSRSGGTGRRVGLKIQWR